MKSEHRHELKTNELAEWLANFPNWVKQNLRTIIYVTVVAAAVIGAVGYRWYVKNVQLVQQQKQLTSLLTNLPQQKMQIMRAQQQGTDYSFILIQTADELRGIAEDGKEDSLAAMALIKRAQTLRVELNYRLGSAGQKEMTDQINLAKAAYTKAIKLCTEAPSLKARAIFGLGLCEEEIGNFSEARKIYEDIVANEEFEGTTAAAEAKMRLEIMDNFRQKVAFKPRPVMPSSRQLKSPVPLLPTLELPSKDVSSEGHLVVESNSPNP